MKHKAWTLILAGMLITGCDKPLWNSQKEDAYEQWAASRADVLTSIAQEQYEVGQLDEAAVKAREALELQPDNHALRLLLAKVLIEKGDTPKALIELRTLREALPHSAEVAYYTGVAMEKAGRHDRAYEQFDRAYQLDPHQLDAALAATETLVTLGQISRARGYLLERLPNPLEDPAAAELAGRLAHMQGDLQQAVGYFQKACDLDTNNHRYPEMLAAALFESGQYARSAEVLDGLLREDGYSPRVWVLRMLGESRLANEEPLAARRAYERACELSPEDVEAWVGLSRSSLMSHDERNAIRSALEARRLDESNPEAMSLLGYALLRTGNTSQAIEVLREATSRHPQDAMLQCLLGRAYETAGRSELARKQYALAVRIDPNNTLAKNLLKHN